MAPYQPGVHEVPGRQFKLAVLNSHPIQYFAPLYRRLAALPGIHLRVYYGSRQNVAKGIDDPGFRREVIWDVPLLEGYEYRFMRNVGGERGVSGFFSLVNFGVVTALRADRPDALIVHGHAHFTALLAILAAKVTRAAVFMRGESNLLLRSTSLRRSVRKPVLRLLYKFCDGFLYIGRLNREFYLHHGVAPEKLFFVPYVVDNERFRQQGEDRREQGAALRRQLGIATTAPVVLYASKLIERKRPLDLLEAHRRLQSMECPPELLFVGDGPELARVQMEVEERQIPRVHFAGFRNQGELPLYYAASDIFVLPSTNEPWGLVVNEAMAAGLPVVTTDMVGAAADLVVNGQTGFTYAAGDVDALQACLHSLVSDEALRRAMAANCVAAMSSWSYDQCVTGISAALNACCVSERDSHNPPD